MWTSACPTASLILSRKDLISRSAFPVRPATNPRSGARSARFRAYLLPRQITCARGTLQQPEDLTGHDCLGYSDEVWQLSNGKRRRSHRAEGRLSTNNGDLLARLVLNGEGIALLPRFIVDADLGAGRRVEVLPDWTTTEIWLTLCYPLTGSCRCVSRPFRTSSRPMSARPAWRSASGRDLPARGRSHIPLRSLPSWLLFALATLSNPLAKGLRDSALPEGGDR